MNGWISLGHVYICGVNSSFVVKLFSRYRYINCIFFPKRKRRNVLRTSGYFLFVIGDSIESHGTTNTNGYRFSTRDVDNDFAPSSCTVARKGAWWHNICTWANLNGDYGNGGCVSAANCNFWYSLTNSYSGVKTSFMMVRRG